MGVAKLQALIEVGLKRPLIRLAHVEAFPTRNSLEELAAAPHDELPHARVDVRADMVVVALALPEWPAELGRGRLPRRPAAVLVVR